METGGARERKRRGRSGNAYEGADWPASEWRPEGRVASRRRAPRLPPRTTTVHPLEVLSVLGDEVDASSRESSPRGWSSSPSSSPRASTTRLANTRHAGQPPNGHPPRGSPSVSRICSAILRRTNRVRFHIYICHFLFFFFFPSFLLLFSTSSKSFFLLPSRLSFWRFVGDFLVRDHGSSSRGDLVSVCSVWMVQSG